MDIQSKIEQIYRITNETIVTIKMKKIPMHERVAMKRKKHGKLLIILGDVTLKCDEKKISDKTIRDQLDALKEMNWKQIQITSKEEYNGEDM